MRARPQTVNISNAYATQAAYRATGVPYELHVLDGCGHASWCWGEPSRYPDPNKQDRGCVSAANARNPLRRLLSVSQPELLRAGVQLRHGGGVLLAAHGHDCAAVRCGASEAQACVTCSWMVRE